jgi:hypothetical protein
MSLMRSPSSYFDSHLHSSCQIHDNDYVHTLMISHIVVLRRETTFAVLEAIMTFHKAN